MKPRIDIELLEAIAGSFELLDELLCPHDRHPLPALVDSTLSEDWSLVRWRPTRLDIPRVGISGPSGFSVGNGFSQERAPPFCLTSPWTVNKGQMYA